MTEAKARVWVITLHRFEHDEGSGGVVDFAGLNVPVGGNIMARHNEVARLEGDRPVAEVARFMERWYAEHYQPGWVEGAELDAKAVIFVGNEIDVGHEPKLSARLVEEPAGGVA